MKAIIRDATLDDLPFLVGQFDEGVSGGHFAGQPGVPTARIWHEWLAKGFMVRKCFRPDGSSIIEQVRIATSIAEADGKPVGFLLTSPETPADTSAIEIYVLSVLRSARRQGVASALIRTEEERHVAGTSFYARCYPKSTWAIAFLQKHGYRVERISPGSGMHYLRKP
ncbi:N-acetyltransferase family protein [Paraburkholderia sp. GAS33]|uniref:GNAT family N-acetyltransferase n=1 Tax=Paraburkholderia sp. GAS33 TaxID=3035130 RepID=UPI003D1FE92F